MATNENGTPKADPSVMALLAKSKDRKAFQSLPTVERAKVKKKRDRQTARIGKRGAYDLEPELIEAMKKIAEDEGTTASQVVGIALHMFLAKRVDLSIYKVKLERNPRYEYELVWKE